jgi:hypothetical protein
LRCIRLQRHLAIRAITKQEGEWKRRETKEKERKEAYKEEKRAKETRDGKRNSQINRVRHKETDKKLPYPMITPVVI